MKDEVGIRNGTILTDEILDACGTGPRCGPQNLVLYWCQKQPGCCQERHLTAKLIPVRPNSVCAIDSEQAGGSHLPLECFAKNVRHLSVSFNKALVFLLSFFIINIYKIYIKR